MADWLNYVLWDAHWAEVDSPLLPNGAIAWWFWQHGCMDPFGPFPKRVCLDRYNGTWAEFVAEFGEITPPEPPQPPDDIQQAIEAAYLARMHIDEALRFLGEDV